MASLFGDSDAVDFINGKNDDLPSDNEQDENLFGDEEGHGEGTEDGASQPIKVEPKKRSVRNPRPRLTVDTLRGPRGIHTIEDYFKDIKLHGRGYEKHDLDEIMRRLQHWGHRMYPTYKFDDVLNNIERLGKKKPLQVHMSRYRLGMLENLRTQNDNEVVDAEEGADEGAANEDEPFDEFDALLGEQIAISKLAPRTPAPAGRTGGHNSSAVSSSTFATPSFSRGNAVMSTPYTLGGDGGGGHDLNDTSEFAQPLPTTQPDTPAPSKLTAEQMARIAENRRIAQERLKAKKLAMEQQQQQQEGRTTEVS